MTVLGGARQLPGAGLPRSIAPRQAVVRPSARPLAGAARPLTGAARRRVSAPSRARRRSSPVRALIGLVLVGFLLCLLYLAQTVRLAALGYETDALVDQRDDLSRQVQTVETSILSWGTEPAVVERAQKLGLDQLPTRVRLSAR